MKNRACLILNLLFSIALACIIFGPHLFDLGSPVAFDVRSHVHKIGYLFHYLKMLKIPQWSPSWYEGFPFLQYYPPCFYFLGALLSFITGSALISYKLLMFLTLASNGFVLFYFMSEVLECDGRISLLAALLYESNILLLLNYFYGTGPNLLGWTLMVLFLTFYVKGMVVKTKGISIHDCMAFVFLTLSIYTHPFSVFFTMIGLCIFHILHRDFLLKLALMCACALMVSAYYWVPVILTFGYASANAIYNIYSPDTLKCIYFFVALGIGSYAAGKKIGNPPIGLDLVMILTVLSVVFGFGFLSSGPLGSLLHGFRFLSIIMPFCVIASVFYFLHISYMTGRLKITGVVVAAACFVLLGPFPWLNDLSLRPLFKYKSDYLTDDYRAVLQMARGGRVVIPRIRGGSFEGDSMVVYGWEKQVETVNGPFNQGDPKFFRHTVHLEWEERWLEHPVTRTNLMQEAGAEFLFIRKGNAPFYTMEGMSIILDNSYGQLWKMNAPAFRVMAVDPILMDVKSPDTVTKFFNILLSDGYRIVLVDIGDIDETWISSFRNVMVDDREKVSRYRGKHIFLLQEDQRISLKDDGDVKEIHAPYSAIDRAYFFHGKKGDERGYREFELAVYPQVYGVVDSLNRTCARQFSGLFSSLAYLPVEYGRNSEGTAYTVTGGKRFTLIKESYFPYWQLKSGNGSILRTSQGFMLLRSDSQDRQRVEYTLPLINWAALACSAATLVALIAVISIRGISRPQSN